MTRTETTETATALQVGDVVSYARGKRCIITSIAADGYISGVTVLSLGKPNERLGSRGGFGNRADFVAHRPDLLARVG